VLNINDLERHIDKYLLKLKQLNKRLESTTENKNNNSIYKNSPTTSTSHLVKNNNLTDNLAKSKSNHSF
jgi:hypothetical protein